MNETNPNRDDLHDQLVDQTLREVVGGEAPPDLSQQILNRAKTQAEIDACVFATTTPGDEAMSTNNHAQKKFGWGALAIAASLLIATGALLLPAVQSARETAQQSKAKSKALPNAKVLGEAQKSAPKDDLILDAVEQPRRSDKDELRMMVTPHVVVQSKEEEQHSFGLRFQRGESDRGLHEQSVVQEKKSTEGSSMDYAAVPAPASGPVAGAEISVGVPWSYLDRGRAAKRVNEESAGEHRVVLSKTPYIGRQLRAEVHSEVNVPRLHETKRNMGLHGLINDSYRGRGPGNSGDQYTRIYENPFKKVGTESTENRLSTFSIDVDTASYANVRQFLMQSHSLPPADAVRIEELVNYFDYDYSQPTGDVPFAAHVEVAGCPWQPAHRLVRVGIKGREIARQQRPQSNLVFLIDVSGSMNRPNKLPLLVEGMKMLTRQLGENDRVAIVVYASSEGLALPSTPGDKQDVILSALEKLRAGGSTAGGAGIALAYKTAQQNFIEGGVNRVILCTDGDFNVGVTSPAALERMAESQAKETGVFLTVLGFGRGNLNDAMMEKISGKGNGNYHYVDGRTEARKVLVEEMSGTLVTIAKDVKIQIEFNPTQVAGYRLIGYENRMLAAEDFNDDKKDAGEIGAGHTVTALYEIVPVGQSVDTPGVDVLKYEQPAKPTSDERRRTDSGEMLTLKIRYKQPDGDKSTKLEFPITDNRQQFGAASDDFKFAAAVASFGMLLRDSEHRGNSSFASVLEITEDGSGRDLHEYRAEFLQIVRQAQQLAGE